MNRRELIRLAALSAGLQTLSPKAYSQIGFTDNPFQLGIASGSPTPDGVVLWTRLLTDGGAGFGSSAIEVTWQVAHDEAFTNMALQGTSTALRDLAYSVHVDLRGLQSDRWYFYRFIVGQGASAVMSDVGRTRTAPAWDARPDRLRFAFASCQRWEHGHYAAYRQMVADNPDLIVFLGDYIYEYASPQKMPAEFVRSHNLRKAVNLADYRDKYALHKSDPLLQAAHRAAPWLLTWDDHEVQNDYASDRNEDLSPPLEFLARRTAAYQAFYEHMPLPASALARGLAGLGHNDGMRINQRVRWGGLANFHLLDCRQYRDPQVCAKPGRGGSNLVKKADCAELQNPNRSMLGKSQETWLSEGLAIDDKQDGASQPWSVIAQSTLLASVNEPAGREPRVWTDGWAGYPLARQRLLDGLRARPGLHPVILSGDVHLNVVANVEGVATEFCGTSLTSRTTWHPEREPSFYADNPSIQYINSDKRGYALAEVTPRLWTTALMGVHDVRNLHSPTTPMAKFAVERGQKTPAKM